MDKDIIQKALSFNDDRPGVLRLFRELVAGKDIIEQYEPQRAKRRMYDVLAVLKVTSLHKTGTPSLDINVAYLPVCIYFLKKEGWDITMKKGWYTLHGRYNMEGNRYL